MDVRAAVLTIAALSCACRGAPPTADRTEPPSGTPPGGQRNPWLEAQARGVDFRAVGQEPGWFVEIDHEGELRLVYDYGERTATAPAPTPVRSGALTTYALEIDSENITISAQEGRCEDVMSGESFPFGVTVTVGGRELRGCGRALRR